MDLIKLPTYSYSINDEDTTPHDCPCDALFHFTNLDKIVLFEKRNVVFKLYNSNLDLLTTVRGHRGPLLSATCNEKHQQIITTSEDCTIRFWSLKEKMRQVNEIKTDTPQICCLWYVHVCVNL